MRLEPEFVQLVTEVAGLLGYKVQPDPDNTYAGIHIIDTDGHEIFLSRDYRNKDRLSVSGSYPGDWNDTQAAMRYRPDPIESVPTISVGIGRGAATIAKEIERRFLPAFIELHTAVVAKIAERTDATATRHAVADRLVALVPGGRINREDAKATSTTISWYNVDDGTGYGDIILNHDGTNAQIQMRSVPIDTIERLVRALAEKETV